MINQIARVAMRISRSTLLNTVAGVAALGTFAIANPSAGHAVTFDLTIDHCTGGCNNGTNPFGTVSVVQNGTSLDFTVTLNGTYVFQKSTGLDAFSFGFTNTPGAITGLTSGFSVDASSPVHQDGFGDFQVGIEKAATGGNSLSFSVANELLANLALSSGGSPSVLFAADIFGNGNTGVVGGPGTPSAVPLPGAIWLFGTALAGMGLLGRRRSKKAFA